MSALPRFDAKASCLKCGGYDVATQWHHVGLRSSSFSCAEVRRLDTSFPPEHLCRTCRRCGYVWAEMTEDTPSARPPEGP
jgi:hypothetical protein